MFPKQWQNRNDCISHFILIMYVNHSGTVEKGVKKQEASTCERKTRNIKKRFIGKGNKVL